MLFVTLLFKSQDDFLITYTFLIAEFPYLVHQINITQEVLSLIFMFGNLKIYREHLI